MMENRKKIGILIIIVALLLLAIIIVMFLKRTKPTIDNNSVATSTQVGNLTPSETVPAAPTSTPGDRTIPNFNPDISKEAPYQIGANDAAKLASLFTERLGSFSNQSDYGNVTDLKILMTANMKDWADKYVADLRAQKYTGEYSGITTHTLVTKVLSYDEKAGKAKIEVQTQRQEQHVDTLGASYLQKMTLDLVRVNNEWLVDGAFWEKK